MVAMSAVVPLADDVGGLLAVLAAVAVTAVLTAMAFAAVLAAGSVTAVLAAGSVAAALAAGSVAAVLAAGSVAAVLAAGSVAAGSVAVQVPVFPAVQVGIDVDRRCNTGPSVSATMPSPDLPFSFWPFPTFDGGAAVLPLSPFVFPDPLVAGVFSFSLRDVGTFFTLAGGGIFLPSLRGTLAALMVGTLHDPAVAGTTVPGDVVAEVLGWDLGSLVLGEGQGGRRCREEVNISQEKFHAGTGDSGYPNLSWLLTPVRNPRTRADERYNEAHGRTRRVIERTLGLLKARFWCHHMTGGSLYYSPKKVCQIIVACCMLHNLALRRQVPFL
ncbi:hypothetical protein NDU88_003172 [Pleurodeles waltl]|uniref:DDE Tnp4 domain-containing protein n=1 Tax=Pleurodeles waltl TaxID=8319 RepID=A0AAV7RHR6_PLEWA|nr:hypothetical protein NDU88_003172 [Pleurodeles waltl]